MRDQDISDVWHLKASVQTKEKKWDKVSEAIDAGATIYGFRVDNIRNETL